VPKYLLGIDIGTYSTKGVLVTPEGHVLANQVVEHGVSRPIAGWAEHDPHEVWWNDVTHVIAALLQRAAAQAADVAAVGISALAPAMVPVDASGKPVRPAILYGIDTRAASEIVFLNRELGWDAPEVPPARRLHAQSVAPKILWFRNHEPQLWEQTRRILSPVGYVVHHLTGAAVIDHANAEAMAPLYDPSTETWDSAMCERFGVPLETLPELHNATEVVGTVTRASAEQTGLSIGTPVICGSMDALAEYLGSGAITPGEGCVVFGSTMSVCVLTAEPRAHPLLYMGRTLVPGIFRLSGGMTTSGALITWFRENFATEMDIALLSSEAANVPAGSEGLVVLPYLAGERTPIFDLNARGLILGLTMYHTRAHVYRALLEGIAYALRQHLELMAEVGVVPRRLIAVGGGIRSELWTQIVSDVTGYKLECSGLTTGAAFADAFLAGYGIGLFTDFSELGRNWVRIGRKVSPNRDAAVTYGRYYKVHRHLYERTREDMHELACLSAASASRR
jgi:xylulokinase